MECRTSMIKRPLLLNTVVPSIRPIDTLIRRENEDGSYRIVSDVTLLFNEDRIINDLGEDNLRNLVRSMQTNPASPYVDSGLTDEQMIIRSLQNNKFIHVYSYVHYYNDEHTMLNL